MLSAEIHLRSAYLFSVSTLCLTFSILLEYLLPAMLCQCLTRERQWWQNQRYISNSEEVIDEKRNWRPQVKELFCLTWHGRSTADLNRSTSKTIRWFLSRSSITLGCEMARGVAPPLGAFSFGEKRGATNPRLRGLVATRCYYPSWARVS